MKRLIAMLLWIGALVVAAPFAYGDGDEKSAEELRSLRGTWEAVTARNAGKDVALKDEGGYRFIIRDEDWIQDAGGVHIYTAANSKIRINASRSPKEFDHIVVRKGTDGKAVTLTYPGIYELDKDELILCFDVDLKTRPKEFSTKSSDNYYLVKLRRVSEASH